MKVGNCKDMNVFGLQKNIQYSKLLEAASIWFYETFDVLEIDSFLCYCGK